jgi:hypothetical protein
MGSLMGTYMYAWPAALTDELNVRAVWPWRIMLAATRVTRSTGKPSLPDQ